MSEPVWHLSFVASLSRAIGNSLHSFSLQEDGVLQLRIFGELPKDDVAAVRALAKVLCPRYKLQYRKKAGALSLHPRGGKKSQRWSLSPGE